MVERQASLLHVFRTYHTEPGTGGESSVRVRRLKVDERAIMRDVFYDLETLFNTLRLELSEPLEDHPRIRRSILNYGMGDLSNMIASKNAIAPLTRHIREALEAFEPRIETGDSLIINGETDPTEDQRIKLNISAIIRSSERRIQIEFDARVDLAEGRINLRRLG